MTRFTALLIAIALPALLLGCPATFESTENPLLGVIVTPDEPVVPIGGEIQLVATAFYEDGTTADVTQSASWSLVGGDAVKLHNERIGKVIGVSSGTTLVTASMQDKTSETVNVRVTDAEVIGLSINPVTLTLDEGDSSWLTAMADFSDGSRGDFSGSVRWITGNNSIVTLAADGRATGVAAGTTNVRAEYDDIAASPAMVEVLEVEDEEPVGDDDDDDTPIGDDDDDDTPIGDDDDTPIGDDDDDAPIGTPDLVVTYFSAYVDVDEGSTYYFVDVTNLGDEASGGFYVDLFLDEWSAPGIGEDGDEYQWIDGLAAGETVYADFDIEDLPVWMEWWSYALLDTLEDVEESDESNNLEGPLEVW